MSIFSNNLRLLREKKGLKLDDFGFLGIKKATMSNYELGNTEPKLNLLCDISKFFGLSIDDILNTDLSILYKENSNECKTQNSGIVVSEPISSFNRKCKERKYDIQRVPLYNIQAIAGLIPLFTGQYTQTVEQYIEIPNAPRCDGAIHVTGDSMYPIIKAGDIIMYKEIHDIEANIFYGEMYLIGLDIEGDEMITVKYIQKSEKEGCIKLVSQNQHHQDRDIEISRIRALAFVKASIRFNHIK